MFYSETTKQVLSKTQVEITLGFDPEFSSPETLKRYGIYEITQTECPNKKLSRFSSEVVFEDGQAVETWVEEPFSLEEAQVTAKIKAKLEASDRLERLQQNEYVSPILFQTLVFSDQSYFSNLRQEVTKVTGTLAKFLDEVDKANDVTRVRELLDNLTYE